MQDTDPGGSSYGHPKGWPWLFWGPGLLLCFLDESGDLQSLPNATSPVQPACVILGVVVPASRLAVATRDFLDLKVRFFPGATKGKVGVVQGQPRYLDSILHEVKGSELRRKVATGGRRQRRHAVGFLDGVMRIVEAHGMRIFGRVLIKGLGSAIDGRAVYTTSAQSICESFQNLLTATGEFGSVVCDSRDPMGNTRVAHSIFTQKYRAGGDPYDRLVELPTFGHSDNHAGLQIADILSSGIIFPMAMAAYCTGHVQNMHVLPGHSAVRQRFGPVIRRVQYRYLDGSGAWRGGIHVQDRLGGKSTGALCP